MPDNFPWTSMTKSAFVAEISDLQGNGKLRGDVLILPDGSETRFSSFSRETDGEGDTTVWTRTINGVKYTVLND